MFGGHLEEIHVQQNMSSPKENEKKNKRVSRKQGKSVIQADSLLEFCYFVGCSLTSKFSFSRHMDFKWECFIRHTLFGRIFTRMLAFFPHPEPRRCLFCCCCCRCCFFEALPSIWPTLRITFLAWIGGSLTYDRPVKDGFFQISHRAHGVGMTW